MVERSRDRVALTGEVDQDLLERKRLDRQCTELDVHAAVERRGQVGADRAAGERRRGGTGLKATAVPCDPANFGAEVSDRRFGCGHAAFVSVTVRLASSTLPETRGAPSVPPSVRSPRIGPAISGLGRRPRRRLGDIFPLDAHAAADGRFDHRLGPVERDHAVGELHGQVARLHANAPLTPSCVIWPVSVRSRSSIRYGGGASPFPRATYVRTPWAIFTWATRALRRGAAVAVEVERRGTPAARLATFERRVRALGAMRGRSSVMSPNSTRPLRSGRSLR